MASKFGERLFKLRREHGITGQKLADKVGVTQPYISYLEREENVSPNIELINKIAEVFCVSTDYLLGLDDKPVLTINEFAEAVAPKIPHDTIHIDSQKSYGQIINVPVYGKEFAACCGEGFPDLSEIYANAEQYIAMPSGFLGPLSGDPQYKPFIIHADGDSMVNAGIHDGAQVIINPYDSVLDGDAALVEFAMNPVTKNIAIKRVYWKDHCGIEIRSADGTGWSRTFTADDFDEKAIRIIGKVEWVGNRPRRG